MNVNLSGDWWADVQNEAGKDLSAVVSIPESLIRGAKEAAHVVIEAPNKVLSTVDKTATGAVQAVGDIGKAVGNALPMVAMLALAAGAAYYFLVIKKNKK